MRDYTKNRILQAFNKLIIHNEFNEITVEMILAESKVSKSTFYRYFKDKYDVMNYNYKIRLDSYSDNKTFKNWKDVIENLYSSIQENTIRIHKSFKYFGESSYYEFLYYYSIEVITRKTLKTLNKNELTKGELFQISHFCSGMVWVTKEWESGYWELTPNEAAEYLYQQMPEFTKKEWL